MLNERFWEIDFLRGTAILMMILFHLIYDLNFFGVFTFELREGLWFYFGILHFIGLAVIISYPFLRFTYYNILFGMLCILLGSYISQITIESPYLLWLGIAPHGLYTFDYYPLLPWFGVVLLGIFVGNILYENGIRKYCIPELGKNYLIRRMTFLGRHSLLIYLVHQPIIILILYGLGYAEISAL